MPPAVPLKSAGARVSRAETPLSFAHTSQLAEHGLFASPIEFCWFPAQCVAFLR